jgi:2'-5' RNA ligase
MTRRTALIVAVPEAEPAVGALRLRHDSSAALGVPAHITLLFPFAPPEEIDEQAVADLVAAHAAFDFELASVERFGGAATWLRPDPPEPFLALIRALAGRWPEYPPYEGAQDEVVPHLTVAEMRIELAVELPIRARAREVLLLEEEAPGGRFFTRARFALRSPP